MSLPASLINRFSSASSALTDRQRARFTSERVNADEETAEEPREGRGTSPRSSDTASLVENGATDNTNDSNSSNRSSESTRSTNNREDETDPHESNDPEAPEEQEGGEWTFRTTMTLAELEEERELARRRMSACVLLTVFVLFKLWIDCIEKPSIPLLMVCLIGTSWTARWIRYNREREEELDRRIAQYLQANQTEAETGGVMDRNDLRMLSFQAQLALAIMESQRHMLEGGRPDMENQTPGVSEAAKEHWEVVKFHDSTQYGSVKEVDGPHCSICLCEYEEGENLAKLPCQHLYHRECIDSWTSNHTKCPLCNLDLEDITSNEASV